MSWQQNKSTITIDPNTGRRKEVLNLKVLKEDPNAVEVNSKQFICRKCTPMQAHNFGRMLTLKCEGGEGGGCGTLYYLVQ